MKLSLSANVSIANANAALAAVQSIGNKSMSKLKLQYVYLTFLQRARAGRTSGRSMRLASRRACACTWCLDTTAPMQRRPTAERLPHTSVTSQVVLGHDGYFLG